MIILRILGDSRSGLVVRQTVEAGIKDSDQGRTLDVNEVRKQFVWPSSTAPVYCLMSFNNDRGFIWVEI